MFKLLILRSVWKLGSLFKTQWSLFCFFWKPSHHQSGLLSYCLKHSLSRKWGWRRRLMGPRGTPARQYASSAFTPRERSVRRASPQLSLPPRDVTRAMLMGLSNGPNLPRILPSWVEKLCRARIWIILLKSHQIHNKRYRRMSGCHCLYLSSLFACHCWSSFRLDHGVPAE